LIEDVDEFCVAFDDAEEHSVGFNDAAESCDGFNDVVDTGTMLMVGGKTSSVRFGPPLERLDLTWTKESEKKRRIFLHNYFYHYFPGNWGPIKHTMILTKIPF